MLQIRPTQMNAFTSVRREEFVRRLLSHLAANYSTWYENQEDRQPREFVERVIDSGETFGVRSESAVSTLVNLMIEFGEEFERSPDQTWAVKMLAHPSLPGHIKLSLLSERLRERSGGRRIVEIEAGSSS